MMIGHGSAVLLVFGLSTAATPPDSSTLPWASLATSDVSAFCADIRVMWPGAMEDDEGLRAWVAKLASGAIPYR